MVAQGDLTGTVSPPFQDCSGERSPASFRVLIFITAHNEGLGLYTRDKVNMVGRRAQADKATVKKLFVSVYLSLTGDWDEDIVD